MGSCLASRLASMASRRPRKSSHGDSLPIACSKQEEADDERDGSCAEHNSAAQGRGWTHRHSASVGPRVCGSILNQGQRARYDEALRSNRSWCGVRGFIVSMPSYRSPRPHGA